MKMMFVVSWIPGVLQEELPTHLVAWPGEICGDQTDTLVSEQKCSAGIKVKGGFDS